MTAFPEALLTSVYPLPCGLIVLKNVKLQGAYSTLAQVATKVKTGPPAMRNSYCLGRVTALSISPLLLGSAEGLSDSCRNPTSLCTLFRGYLTLLAKIPPCDRAAAIVVSPPRTRKRLGSAAVRRCASKCLRRTRTAQSCFRKHGTPPISNPQNIGCL